MNIRNEMRTEASVITLELRTEYLTVIRSHARLRPDQDNRIIALDIPAGNIRDVDDGIFAQAGLAAGCVAGIRTDRGVASACRDMFDEYYTREFTRPGSPMKQPSAGRVVWMFAAQGNQPYRFAGFFYSERSEAGSIAGSGAGLTSPAEMPQPLRDVLDSSVRNGDIVDRSSLPETIFRTKRVYVFPQYRGHGYMKAEMVLSEIIPAFSLPGGGNFDEFIEARAGGPASNPLSQHLLVPIYLSFGFKPVVISDENGSLQPFVWFNDPYLNCAMVRHDIYWCHGTASKG